MKGKCTVEEAAQQLQANNELIARFVGYTEKITIEPGSWAPGFPSEPIVRLSQKPKPDEKHGSRDWHDITELRYHEDWRWLMPVVEKIEKLHYTVNIYQNRCDISIGRADYPIKTIENSKISAVFYAVVRFIEGHNKPPQIVLGDIGQPSIQMQTKSDEDMKNLGPWLK